MYMYNMYIKNGTSDYGDRHLKNISSTQINPQKPPKPPKETREIKMKHPKNL